MSAEHDLQQLRDLGRVRLAAVDFDDESAAALSRVGERIDAQQARISELESLVAKSGNRTPDVRGGMREAYRFTVEGLRRIGCSRRGLNGGVDCEEAEDLSDEEWCERCAALSNANDALIAADFRRSVPESASEPVTRGPVSGAGGNTAGGTGIRTTE